MTDTPAFTLAISPDLLAQIHVNGEAAYPEEGAGLLLGREVPNGKRAEAILPLANAREESARHNRYLIPPQEMLRGEQAAERLGLEVIGVFHSHPDHPDQPSETDREWALPWYSYIITSVQDGRAVRSRSWRLQEDHLAFREETLAVYQPNP